MREEITVVVCKRPVSKQPKNIFLLNIGCFLSENLAMNKPAWQTPLSNNSWRSEFAVDGNAKLCTISADKQSTAEWHVDLGNVSSVREISIYYRTDDISWGIYF